jgi:hypothetical protein
MVKFKTAWMAGMMGEGKARKKWINKLAKRMKRGKRGESPVDMALAEVLNSPDQATARRRLAYVINQLATVHENMECGPNGEYERWTYQLTKKAGPVA